MSGFESIEELQGARPAQLDGQPLAIGVRGALPYVDDFVAGYDPRAVTKLARLIGTLAARPPRRQRPARAAGAFQASSSVATRAR